MLFFRRSGYRLLSTLLAGCVFAVAVPNPAAAETRTVTYLENSDHELTIYFINGKEPGKTLMIMGGIQGDEPGGYLAADLYADMLLEKGNLIVVPRANFFSIRNNNRGVNGDMNRKFSQNGPQDDYDSRIVAILSSLMEKSDAFINLHEGSGFYHPEYIDNLRNPMRYGQSIIADTDVYTLASGKTVDLKGLAQRVIEEINKNIKNPEHHFRFNNHNTFSEKSRHKEQRKSATFHALSVVGIPAYGIEASKEIKDIQTKVRYQTLVINAFMSEFGIVPEHPSIFLPPPELDHLVINVPGNPVPFAVRNGSSITVPSGTSIHVTDVVANYERGLSVDVVGAGISNDLNRVVMVKGPTVIKVFKDAFPCGEVHVTVTDPNKPDVPVTVTVSTPFHIHDFEIRASGKNMVVSAGDTLHIIRGDILEIVGARSLDNSWTDFRINFVGFVGNEQVNDAEDRGYKINTATELIRRFSVDSEGFVYKIEALNGSRVAGTMYIKLQEPRVEYLIAERSDGVRLALAPGSTVSCTGETGTIKLLSVVSNVSDSPRISLHVHNAAMGEQEILLPFPFEVRGDTEVQFRCHDTSIGSIHFRADR